MFTLYKKELNYYLNNPVGYIIVILFAVFANFLFVKDIFVTNSASMRPFFIVVSWLMLIFVPALTMRIISEEKRTNTLETLMSLPVSESQIILAKFFALLTLISIGLALTLSLPISLSYLTKMYLPEVFIGYIGLILYAAVFVAVSMFFSSITKNQVVAFLSSIILLFCLLVLYTDFFASALPKVMQDWLNYLSPLYHLENFIKGLIDFRSLFYFCSVASVFIFLTIVNLEKRS